MQIAEPRSPVAPSATVLGPSLSFDLGWSLFGAFSPYLRGLHPVLADLYEQHPELEQRVRSFWPTEPAHFAELEVLTLWSGSAAATDFETVRRGLERGIAELPADIEIPSETDDVRTAICDRVAELRDSSERRKAYFTLLADVWALVAPWWEREGMAVAERGATQMQEQLSRGGDWHRLVSTECEVFESHLPEILDRFARGDRVLLVPCALFGRGLYLDVNAVILVGFPAAGADDLARARTAQVVRRLRALADPTRLAIFDYLKGGPSSVSEVATVFSLAQPTVSVHVKHLREAGLVTSQRRGPRLEIGVDPAAAGQLADEVATLLRP
jgi:ArsR family transcriptional regulator, arsenate/arsenite/antimonite-responsive transcriptional repressor